MQTGGHIEAQEAEVARLLNANPMLAVSDDGFYIMLPQSDGVILYSDLNGLRTYLMGRRYKNLIEHANYNFSKYSPHVVPTKTTDGIDELHCILTDRHFARDSKLLDDHVKSTHYRQ